jgi:putative glycosyltransferase
MELSVVTSLYRSAAYIEEFYTRVCAAASRVVSHFEIVFVNDGSPDNSLFLVLELQRQDSRVRIIDLARNFGHHKALMTGLAHAQGDLVFLIDCDLEEKPELLEQFYSELRQTGSDVIFGVQRQRKGGLIERLSGALFFKLFSILSDHPVPSNQVVARLMTRRYVASLVQYRDQQLYLAGLCSLAGYQQSMSYVDKTCKGVTTYNLHKRITAAVDAITSFSAKPLVFIFYLGGAVSLLATLGALYLIIKVLFFQDLLVGWPSVIVSIWLLGGMMLASVGLIGIYLSRIFMETKPRPYTVVREVYQQAQGTLTHQAVHLDARSVNHKEAG